MIGMSGSLIWSETLMGLIFNPCGEFRLSPEDPVSQIYSPHLHAGAPEIYQNLFKCQRESGGDESNGKLPHLSIPSKTTAWVPERERERERDRERDRERERDRQRERERERERDLL